ncbi:hus1-like protein isoform X2 [Wolffia australiana]
MKFKAFLTEEGVNLLDKRFLPALDKVGRVCLVYFTRNHAMFLHNLLNGDGVQCVAQFDKDLLFSDYRISSKNDDKIVFSLDLALLQRALRSAVSILHSQGGCDPSETGDLQRSPRQVQIKLLKKSPPGSQQPSPFLSFETKGYKSAVVHDVPISRPLSKDDVAELQGALDMAQQLPQTLVQIPDLGQLQILVERLKNVGELLSVSIAQYGDLHLQVSTGLVTLGSEFRRLRVLGTRADAPAGDHKLTPESRTRLAIERGEAQSVQVSMKHLSRSLQCHFAKPDCAYYVWGICRDCSSRCMLDCDLSVLLAGDKTDG